MGDKKIIQSVTGMGTSITSAGCSVYDTAVTGNEPSSCLVYWSGTTITFTAVMSTGAASTTGAYLTWWVFGQP